MIKKKKRMLMKKMKILKKNSNYNQESEIIL